MSVKTLVRSFLTETYLVHYLIFEDKNEEGWKSMQEFIFRVIQKVRGQDFDLF